MLAPRLGNGRAVSGSDILVSAVAAASVVLCGGLHALLFALGRLRSSAVLARAALGAYGGLAASALVLVHALGLSGVWLALVGVVLVGYLLAPGAIWHLSVATHAAGHDDGAEAGDR